MHLVLAAGCHISCNHMHWPAAGGRDIMLILELPQLLKVGALQLQMITAENHLLVDISMVWLGYNGVR